MTISERFSISNAYASVNESKRDICEWIEDPNEDIKAKMAAHGYEYDDIDSDPENGYIVFFSDNGLFPSGGFKSWEEVSDWINNVIFDESYNDVGVSEADEFGRPDDLFAKMAAIQSHKFDRRPYPTKDELRKQMDDEVERAKASGRYVKLDSERAARDGSSKYEETVVVPQWMVKDVQGKPGTNIEQWIGPSRLDKNKLGVVGSFEKGTQGGFAYTNGYIACLRYAIPYWDIVGRTEDGGVKIKIPLNNGSYKKYRFYEKPFGYAMRRGVRVLSFLGRDKAPEYISSEELISRIDDYISAVKQYGGIENYKKLGEELRERKIAEIEAVKREREERAADMDAADAERYGSEVAARESVEVSEDAHGPQLVDAVAYNIEWDPQDRYEVISDDSESAFPERVEVNDITFNPDEDDMEEILKKYIYDNYGCMPDFLEYDITDWKGEYEEESVDITDENIISDMKREHDKPTVDYTKAFVHDAANQPKDSDGAIVPTLENFDSALEAIRECIDESDGAADGKKTALEVLGELKNTVKDENDVKAFMEKYADDIKRIEGGEHSEDKTFFGKVKDFVWSSLKAGGGFVKKHWGKILIALAVILLWIYWPQAKSGASKLFGSWFGGGNSDVGNAEIDTAVAVSGTPAEGGETVVDIEGQASPAGDSSKMDPDVTLSMLKPDPNGDTDYAVPPEYKDDIDWNREIHYKMVDGDNGDKPFMQILGYTDKSGKPKKVDWDGYWKKEGLADESVSEAISIVRGRSNFPTDKVGDRVLFEYGDDDIEFKEYEGTIVEKRSDSYVVEFADDEFDGLMVIIPFSSVVAKFEDDRGIASEPPLYNPKEDDFLYEGADERQSGSDEEYPIPAAKLYELKTVKAAQKLIYSTVSPLTKGLFHDEDWSNVRKVFEAMSGELGMNVNWGVRHDNFYSAGYSPDGKSKAYMFDAKFTNVLGRKVKINGQLICSGAGTVEEPLKSYDMAFILF